MSGRGSSTATFLIAALTVTLLCCARREQPPAPAAAPRPARASVKMNFNPNVTYGPFMIAREEGFFEQEGIDVSFETVDANTAMLAVTSGRLDVMASPVRAGLFNMMARGAALQIVADRGHSRPDGCNAEAFVAPVATAERIAKRGGSFRGEKFALVRGGMTEYLIDRILETNGLTRADVEFVQLPQGDQLTSVNRPIDAIRFMIEPQLSNFVELGVLRVVVEMETIAPGHQFGVITFGQRLLQKEPEVGQRFMRAYVRGVRQYNQGKTERNVAILSKHTTLPPEIIRRACWQTLSDDGSIRPEAMQPFLAWARKNGYLEADVPVSTWWNPSFIDAAQ